MSAKGSRAAPAPPCARSAVVANALCPDSHELASLSGRLKEPKGEILPWAERLADFAAYQQDELGLSPATIIGQGWHGEKVLNWLGQQNRASSMSRGRMWIRSSPAWERTAGAVFRGLAAPRSCALSSAMHRGVVGVQTVSLPAPAARACSSRKTSPPALRGRMYGD
jgi:hypothetical protein